MNKLFALLIIFTIPCKAQQTDRITWKLLFEIHDAQSGVLREAKISNRLFQRMSAKSNIWRRNRIDNTDGTDHQWTEEIHLNSSKPETVIFVTSEPAEFDRLVKSLTDQQVGTGEGQGFASLEARTFASGRTMSSFSKSSRLVEVLSNNNAGTQEWIFQLSKTAPATPTPTKDKTPPVISIIEPKEAQTKSLVEVRLSRISVKIKVSDGSGIKSVVMDGKLVKPDVDSIYSQVFTLPPNLSQKTVKIEAIDNPGNVASALVTLKSKLQEPITASDETNFEDIAQGRYYALIISVQSYQPGIRPLSNPHKDGEALSKVLLRRYKFNAGDVSILRDPTVAELGQALEKLKATLTKKDNLLIFFSGHGEWDEKIGQGYWLLKDAEYKNQATWISNSTVKDYIRGINSRHTLLVTDACFGGSISSKSADDTAEKKIYKLPSRIAITSGNLEQVPDNSVFMKYFLERLRENESKYLPALAFFSSFYTAVISNSGENTPHQPQYSRIDNTGHQGGDFIFTLK
ncbi:caspase family protein [Dyadobacter sp. LJ53]|uniref:caspase family protein n=1 Tax=Dyadobacter chenwenxiniae TaxID=2906456 RepID=UPI001F3AC3C5|nr:caspase family protein [Dyadobacter chenwenxiniae]MCF0051614.1 caspase family protein [Dyadobacter chenwenxiniae]